MDRDFSTISIGRSNFVLIGSIFSISTFCDALGVSGWFAATLVMSPRGSVIVLRWSVDEPGDSDGAGVGNASERSTSGASIGVACTGCVGGGGGGAIDAAADGSLLLRERTADTFRFRDTAARVGDGGMTLLSSALKICEGSMLGPLVDRRVPRAVVAFGVASGSTAGVFRRVVRFAALFAGAGVKTSSSEDASALLDCCAMLSSESDSSIIFRRVATRREGREVAAGAMLISRDVVSRGRLLRWGEYPQVWSLSTARPVKPRALHVSIQH